MENLSIAENIAERILLLSKRFKSLRSFAIASEIDPNSMLGYVESGQRKPSKPTSTSLAKIIKATNCNGHWLLTGEGEIYQPFTDKYDDVINEIYFPSYIVGSTGFGFSN